jgi:hypothetical protein
MARGQVGRHLGEELVGGVAVPVGQQHLVAGEQQLAPRRGPLEPGVLADLEHPRQHQVALVRDDAGPGEQAVAGGVGVDRGGGVPRRVGLLDPAQPLRVEVGGLGGGAAAEGFGVLEDRHVPRLARAGEAAVRRG